MLFQYNPYIPQQRLIVRKYFNFLFSVLADGGWGMGEGVSLAGRVIVYSGRTKYSAFVSKLNKLSEEYLSPQKTQKAAVFFIQKILDL
jgi:hypothetical protein